MEKNKCGICSKSIGLMSRHKAIDGYVCTDCLNSTGYNLSEQSSRLRSRTVSGVSQDIANRKANQLLLANFAPTKKIKNYIHFDETKRQFLLPQGLLGSTKKSWVYSFSDIQEYELLENGGSVSSGGLGRALVGGVLFGGVGAVVGGVTGRKKGTSTVSSMQIKITTNDMSNPAAYITFIRSGTQYKTNSLVYRDYAKSAQEILATLSIIVNGKSQTQEIAPPSNAVTQLREYKQLLDDGIITQAEFDKKKQELLT